MGMQMFIMIGRNASTKQYAIVVYACGLNSDALAIVALRQVWDGPGRAGHSRYATSGGVHDDAMRGEEGPSFQPALRSPSIVVHVVFKWHVHDDSNSHPGITGG
jgi:hypothetical protein